MSDRTTIEITQERKEQLRDARLSYESNYDETIARLLGESHHDYLSVDDVREIAREEVRDHVVREALE